MSHDKRYVRLLTSDWLLINPDVSPETLYEEGRRMVHGGIGLLLGFAAYHDRAKASVSDLSDLQQSAMPMFYGGMQLIERSHVLSRRARASSPDDQ